MRRIVAAVLVLVFASLPALAQMGNDDAVKIRERVIRFKMTRLIDVLDMDEATAEKFFVKYNLSQNAIREAQQSLDSAINELERAVNENNRPRIKELTELALSRHHVLQETIADMLRSVRPLLSEDQYARFLIFEGRFQEEIKKRLMERRNRDDDDGDRKSRMKRKRDRD